MMNLELLLWGAANGGDPGWREMALTHARVTGRDLVRADGGTFHVVDYEPATGAVRLRGTYQGYADGSTWSRGQAWAIYGYTMVYRHTRDPEMLALARKTAAWWLARTPADGVPNWDFDAPTQRKDSSAGAAVAAAFLELAGYVGEGAEAARYRGAALAALDALSSPAYLASGPSPASILLHGVGHLPAGKEIDVGLVYGDHYFLEAVLRHTPRPPLRWVAAAAGGGTVRQLGTGNGGVRTIALDVTPRAAPIDGVVGWADASTTPTGAASYAIAVRLAPSGVFEVRDGEAWTAATRVPYAAGATYRLRVLADPGARRYAAWVTPPGGPEVALAHAAAFRSDAPAADDVGKVGLVAGADGDFAVEAHRMAEGAGPLPQPPIGAPSPEPVPGPPAAEPPPDAGPPPGGARDGCTTAGAGGAGALPSLALALAALRWLRRGLRREGPAHASGRRPG
jgi:unsaturated chondroitin disaccharide hydrolase